MGKIKKFFVHTTHLSCIALFQNPKNRVFGYPIDHYRDASITGTNISSLQFFLYTWWGTLIVSSLPSSMIFSSSSSVSMLPDSLISKFVKGQIVNSPAHKVKKIVMDTSTYKPGKIYREFFLLLVNLLCVHIGNFLYFWNYYSACLQLLLLSIYNFIFL